MDGRCKDCKWWDDGECSSPKFVYDITPIDGLSYWDGPGVSAGFSTGPEFGCIHFEAEGFLDTPTE